MMYNVLDWTLTQAITRLEKKGYVRTTDQLVEPFEI